MSFLPPTPHYLSSCLLLGRLLVIPNVLLPPWGSRPRRVSFRIVAELFCHGQGVQAQTECVGGYRGAPAFVCWRVGRRGGAAHQGVMKTVMGAIRCFCIPSIAASRPRRPASERAFICARSTRPLMYSTGERCSVKRESEGGPLVLPLFLHT